MAEIKAIFLKGWLNTTNMNTGDWFSSWFKSASKAEAEGCELTVFKIPKTNNNWGGQADPQLVEEIEELIQSRYPNHKFK